MTDTTIAQTIAMQIGGRAFQMMGTMNKVAIENGLAFNLRGSEISKIRVLLAPDDTYTLEFWKGAIGRHPMKLPHTATGVYADGLHQCIEYRTGLCLSLGTFGKERV